MSAELTARSARDEPFRLRVGQVLHHETEGEKTARAQGTSGRGTILGVFGVVAASQVTGSSNLILIPQWEFHLDPGLGPPQLTSEVSIAGTGARLSVIYAGSGSRVLQIAGTSASTSHLTVRDGSTIPSDPHGDNIKASPAP